MDGNTEKENDAKVQRLPAAKERDCPADFRDPNLADPGKVTIRNNLRDCPAGILKHPLHAGHGKMIGRVQDDMALRGLVRQKIRDIAADARVERDSASTLIGSEIMVERKQAHAIEIAGHPRRHVGRFSKTTTS